MKYLLIALLSTFGSAYADGASITLGAGKSLNNTNTAVPGWLVSIHARGTIKGPLYADAGYTRMGASQLATDAAFTTMGVGVHYGDFSLGVAEIVGASYSAEVWWDKDDPEHECNARHCGKKYKNNGWLFSRACHLCGTVVSVDYNLGHNFSVRGEYYGLLHMKPTFQGVVVQLRYSVGGK